MITSFPINLSLIEIVSVFLERMNLHEISIALSWNDKISSGRRAKTKRKRSELPLKVLSYWRLIDASRMKFCVVVKREGTNRKCFPFLGSDIIELSIKPISDKLSCQDRHRQRCVMIYDRDTWICCRRKNILAQSQADIVPILYSFTIQHTA